MRELAPAPRRFMKAEQAHALRAAEPTASGTGLYLYKTVNDQGGSRMRVSRISIAGAMIAIIVIALGLAALVRPSEMAAHAAFSLAMASIGVAILGVVFGHRRCRAGWGGYLLFAGGYLAICFTPWFVDNVRPRLLTSSLIDYGYRDLLSYAPTHSGEVVWFPLGSGEFINGRFTGELRNGSLTNSPTMAWIERGGARVGFLPSSLRAVPPATFSMLADSLVAILLGWFGSICAKSFESRRRPAPPAPTIGVDPPILPGL